MRRESWSRVAAVSLVAVLLLTALAGSADAGRYRDRWVMKRETNGSRLHHDLRRVDLNAQMSELARRHSVKMAKRDSLFHTPDPAGTYLRGVSWHAWGENVGVTGGDVDDLQRAFMASSPHRANILTRTFRHVAIGAVRVDGKLWVTVFFYG